MDRTPNPAAEVGMPGARVVVIDDDYAMRLSCRQILAKSGYDVEVFEDGAKGVEAVLAQRPDLVVVDLKMPGISGLDVIGRVRAIDPDMVVVVITGYPTIGSAVDAIKAGAFDFLPKPFTPDELRVVVKRALGRRRLLLESHRLELERELLKRRFVTFVSHQLKSPLVAIRQYMDVLLRLEGSPEAAEQRAEWLTRSRRRCDQMVRLIEDWLLLSRTECSELVRRRDPLKLGEILEEIIEASQGMADEAGVSLDLALPEGDLMVAGDGGCVSVLFTNLVENAIAYNRPDGRVHVSVRVERGEVCVAVADTGRGISEEYRSLVFDEFFRVTSEEEPAPAGTGLGLPIAKRIVTEMGGRIDLQSEVGVGSTFTVRIPLLAADALRATPSPHEEALT